MSTALPKRLNSSMNLKEIFVKHKCDKGMKHGYWKLYQEDFEPVRYNQIDILEIGTFKGESTNAWLDYFPKANIYTIDTFERVQAKDLHCLNDSRVEWAQLDSTSEDCETHFNTNKTLTNPTINSPTITTLTATNLTLTDSSIVFEGATADAHETTLTVTDPTADRTITLPNETGTLITSASAATNAFSISIAAALG